jgi:hypothetical protein
VRQQEIEAAQKEADRIEKEFTEMFYALVMQEELMEWEEELEVEREAGEKAENELAGLRIKVREMERRAKTGREKKKREGKRRKGKGKERTSSSRSNSSGSSGSSSSIGWSECGRVLGLTERAG